MKHTLKITLILVILFFFSQVVGLFITDKYIDHKTSIETGEIVFKELPYEVSRPVVEQTTSFSYIIAAILIGTVLVLLLIKFKKTSWWKLWFFLSVWLVLTVSFAAFINQNLALILALILALWKISKPGVIIHNLTEVFIYGGLSAIFVPIMNVFSAFMMLLFISIYDMVAVWKIKHMIKLAKFQASTKVFAGLFIPYKRKEDKVVREGVITKLKLKPRKEGITTAILGGGDIGFPLIFAGVVMKGLMLKYSFIAGFLISLIIPLFVSIALLTLFLKSKKDKYYPAMPFLSIGCLIGWLVILVF
jgi:presenilin-like A22 family membrane protease